ncbi:NUDIX domain-containing protein [Thioflexithrix psekupsensis]|uniref:ADP-ribose pyrophosphatase n=1 Tax=Thioflexithrix psekupsensis TaxID=1570016 RepID=A0A251X8B9_9GAMM|nr:NUDIX domain-containing protein [Thioflexithrix psekupsensis]OUD13923.1 ADP-ribose diphosphatase [Thioflexithrix psekupsensis]
MSEQDYSIIEKQLAYDGYFKILRYRVRYRCFAGDWHDNVVREVFERGHAVAVLPYDPQTDQVILIEQFRIAPAAVNEYPWLMEIVAGIIETGEKIESVAYREMQEEIGCETLELIPMYQAFVSPGGTTETVALFCGRIQANCFSPLHGKAEEQEDIRAHLISRTTALSWLAEGKIRSLSAITALQWLALHYAQVQEQWGDGK